MRGSAFTIPFIPISFPFLFVTTILCTLLPDVLIIQKVSCEVFQQRIFCFLTYSHFTAFPSNIAMPDCSTKTAIAIMRCIVIHIIHTIINFSLGLRAYRLFYSPYSGIFFPEDSPLPIFPPYVLLSSLDIEHSFQHNFFLYYFPQRHCTSSQFQTFSQAVNPV